MANVSYAFPITRGGLPQTGESPTFDSFFSFATPGPGTDLSGSAPAITEIGGGWYGFAYDTELLGEAVAVIDAGVSFTGGERYTFMPLTKNAGRVLAGFNAFGQTQLTPAEHANIGVDVGNQLAEQALTPVAGSSVIPDFYPGDPVALFSVSLPGLPTPASSVTLGVKVLEGASSTVFTVSVTTSAGAEGQITNTGVVQPDGTYTATAQLALLSAKTVLLMPGQTYWAYLQTLPGPETVASFAFTPRSGGALG